MFFFLFLGEGLQWAIVNFAAVYGKPSLTPRFQTFINSQNEQNDDNEGKPKQNLKLLKKLSEKTAHNNGYIACPAGHAP